MCDRLLVITPSKIEFYLNDNKKEYEEFKVLNHYDKTHKFKVSFDPNKYSVVPSEFKIDAKQKVICKIKPIEKAVSSSSGEMVEIFIHMFDDLTSQVLASRTLEVKLIPGDRPSGQQSSSLEKSSSNTTNNPIAEEDVKEVSNKKELLCLAFIGLLLLVFLPTTDVGTQSFIPEFLHISTSLKMICVFLMGVLANQFYHVLN